MFLLPLCNARAQSAFPQMNCPFVKAFLTVAATYGEAPLSAKGNVPLAQSLQTKVLAAIKAIS